MAKPLFTLPFTTRRTVSQFNQQTNMTKTEALQQIKDLSDAERDDNECNHDPMAVLEKIYQIAREALEDKPEAEK